LFQGEKVSSGRKMEIAEMTDKKIIVTGGRRRTGELKPATTRTVMAHAGLRVRTETGTATTRPAAAATAHTRRQQASTYLTTAGLRGAENMVPPRLRGMAGTAAGPAVATVRSV
jgi:hypothetical protein